MAGSNERLPARARYPLTISALACCFGLSRSTLLYYHRIGLLRPSAKSPAGYRLYAPVDGERLARIVELRAAGLSLAAIRHVLGGRAELAAALALRVGEIDAQVAALGAQRDVLAAMLDGTGEGGHELPMSKEAWSAMFRAIGLDDAAMHRWHAEFERSMPQAHAAFLRSLGLGHRDVARIRRRCRSAEPDEPAAGRRARRGGAAPLEPDVSGRVTRRR